MDLIEVKNLSVSYKDMLKSITVLRDVSFSIKDGDYVCITGENGAGKSTLVRAILGLIKISSGKVVFKNNLKLKDVSYVSQFCESFEKIPITLNELVSFGALKPKTFGLFYSKKDKMTIFHYLKLLNLEKVSDFKVSELSGGQKKKALLCRALCANPKVIILDEPCASLDEKSSNELYEILERLNKEKNITIIMVIHDLNKAKKIANKIINLKEGKVFINS